MSFDKTYAVLGLGRYGRAVARTLAENGADVIAVDSDESIVNELALEVPVCKCADVTDPEVIEQLGIGSADVAVIAMASSLEASIMAIVLCKEAGVKTVIAKCSDKMHGKIMTKVGADQVIEPEHESGIRLAKSMLRPGINDIMDLSSDISMIEMDVRPEWAEKSIQSLDLRRKYSINIVAIRDGNKVIANIRPELILKSSMKLIVLTDISSKAIKKIR